MAKSASFDIVSEFDFNELTNAINQSKKEIETRYDFKGAKASIKLLETEIQISADSESKLEAIIDIIQSKAIKRNISIKIFDYGKVIDSAGNTVKQTIKLKKGIEQDISKKIIGKIKESKLKVQTQIQGDAVRVTAKSIDDLQEVIALLKDVDLDLPLQFNNYRS